MQRQYYYRPFGEPRTADSTFTQLLSSWATAFVQCCFTSTQALRTVRDGEPGTSTSPGRPPHQNVHLTSTSTSPGRPPHQNVHLTRTSTSTFTQLLSTEKFNVLQYLKGTQNEQAPWGLSIEPSSFLLLLLLLLLLIIIIIIIIIKITLAVGFRLIYSLDC